ncbi:uncharacterized protein PHA67_005571 [Liasis olivaceus]
MCGEKGHFVAACPQNPRLQPAARGKKPEKPAKPIKAPRRSTAARGEEERLTIAYLSDSEDGGESAGEREESPRRDQPIPCKSIEDIWVSLMTYGVVICAPRSTRRARLTALLDSGCSRSLISPVLVNGLNLKVHRLKTPIIFRQVDGTAVGGGAVRYCTEAFELKVGTHRETLKCLVAPLASYPLILGMSWLERWDPRISWREKTLTFLDGGRGIAKVEPHQ